MTEQATKSKTGIIILVCVIGAVLLSALFFFRKKIAALFGVADASATAGNDKPLIGGGLIKSGKQQKTVIGGAGDTINLKPLFPVLTTSSGKVLYYYHLEDNGSKYYYDANGKYIPLTISELLSLKANKINGTI